MALISSNVYLSMENATDNAQYIYNFMIRNGASQNAALAVLGNMYAESTCNPGIWQNLDSSRTDLGFGLVQWTPSTKYTNWQRKDTRARTSMDSCSGSSTKKT